MGERIHLANIESVTKAVDLLRSRPMSKAPKNHRKICANLDRRTAFHCYSIKSHNSRNRKRKKVTSSAFSNALVAIEMRKCLMRHDWTHITELLPLLFEGRLETEPLIWRYLVIELLYGHKGTSVTLNHFLEMCVGSDAPKFLKQILTLPSQEMDSNST